MNLGPHQNYVSAVHHLLIIGIGTVLAAQVFLCAARPARCVIRLVPHLCGVNSTQDGVKTRCTQFALFFLLAFIFCFLFSLLLIYVVPLFRFFHLLFIWLFSLLHSFSVHSLSFHFSILSSSLSLLFLFLLILSMRQVFPLSNLHIRNSTLLYCC